MTEELSKAYHKYFGFSPALKDKSWVPNTLCPSCFATLSFIAKGRTNYFSFGTPMIWREPYDHTTDCYFCLTIVTGVGKRMTVTYPNEISSVTKPVEHSVDLPKPHLNAEQQATTSRKRKVDTSLSDMSGEDSETSEWSGTEAAENEKKHLLTQAEINDLCRDLYLSKTKCELLGSRLQQWGYFAEETRVTYFRYRSDSLKAFFGKAGNYCFCHDVPGLFQALKQKYDPTEWRVFIDGGKNSIKAVLLHKGNKKPSIPIGHVSNIKESYESMKKILHLIDYDIHNWKICADLKVIAILCGLQGGYTKYPCFLCLWDSRDHKNHFFKRLWQQRKEHTMKEHNIINDALIDKNNIILPPLHIKLGLMKNFVKAIKNNVGAIEYLQRAFPKLSIEKVKAGVFIGPQIRKLFDDDDFIEVLNLKEREAWEAFRDVVHNFLGIFKSDNHAQLIDKMLQKYNAIGMFVLILKLILFSNLFKLILKI